MPDWLWQGITSSLIWELVLILGVGIVLERLKAKVPTFAGRILYVLAGMACVSIMLFTFTGRAILSQQSPETTPENVQKNIRAWLDTFKLGEQEQSDDNSYFNYVVALPNGNHVIVARPKARDHYITFTASVTVSQEHAVLLAKMNKDEAQQIADEVALDISMYKIGHSMVGPSPLKGVILIKGVPITSSLTESAFISHLDEMDNAVSVALEAIRTTIETHNRAAKSH